MSKLKKLIRLISSKQSLYESLLWGINLNFGGFGPDYRVRNDLETIAVCEGVRIEVFWKKLKIGIGPALSLYMLDEEILRIDCFGKGAGHLHIAFFLPGEGEQRLWMNEETIPEQVERVRFELNKNYRYYQCRVPNPKIRALKIDEQKMRDASELAFKKMNRLIEVASCHVSPPPSPS